MTEESEQSSLRAELLRFSSRARMLEAAVETMSLGVTVTDLAGRIVYANRADAVLHGFAAEELVGRPATLFEDPSASHRVPPAMEGRGPWARETTNLTRLGERIPVRLVSDVIRGDADEEVGRVTVCEDLRDEKRILGALSRRDRILTACGILSERLFESDQVEDALPDALGLLAEATESDLVQFYGAATAGSAPQLVWRRSTTAPDAERLAAAMARVATGERSRRPLAGPLSELPPDVAALLAEHGLASAALLGVELPGSSPCSLLLACVEGDREWNDGELDAAAIAARSLAASFRRRQTLRRLNEEELRFQRLVDEASDLIQSVDDQGRLLYVNRAWARALGCPPGQALGRPMLDFVAPESRGDCATYLRELVDRGGDRRIELVFESSTGERIEADGAVSVQRQADGTRLTLGIFRDVTEQRRLERLQQEFLSTVSHELRTPLTSLLGSLTLLRDDRIAAQRGQWIELLDIASRNGDRLLRLINDLLDLRKVETRGLRLRISPLRAREILHEAEEGIRGFAGTLGVRVAIDDRSDDAELLSDRDRLVQVLFNLLSNAIKFSSRGDTVLLIASREGDDLILEVVDRGPGIATDLRQKLFQPFVESDDTPDRSGGGAGLGLAIAKGIVGALGGEIEIRASDAAGTRVAVRLPRHRP